MRTPTSIRQAARRLLTQGSTEQGSASISQSDLEQLLSEVEMLALGWTPVGSCLPPEGRRILFFSTLTQFVHVGTRYGDRWFDENAFVDGVAVAVEDVSHWMRMPRRPSRR